jgi:hypothetical protein
METRPTRPSAARNRNESSIESPTHSNNIYPANQQRFTYNRLEQFTIDCLANAHSNLNRDAARSLRSFLPSAAEMDTAQAQ